MSFNFRLSLPKRKDAYFVLEGKLEKEYFQNIVLRTYFVYSNTLS